MFRQVVGQEFTIACIRRMDLVLLALPQRVGLALPSVAARFPIWNQDTGSHHVPLPSRKPPTIPGVRPSTGPRYATDLDRLARDGIAGGRNTQWYSAHHGEVLRQRDWISR